MLSKNQFVNTRNSSKRYAEQLQEQKQAKINLRSPKTPAKLKKRKCQNTYYQAVMVNTLWLQNLLLNEQFT